MLTDRFNKDRGVKPGLLLASGLIFLSQAVLAAPEDFAFKYSAGAPTLFNPHPMKDDIILDLPCQDQSAGSVYKIVFRKVYTSEAGGTGGAEFSDGGGSGNVATQGKRTYRVSGNFKDERGYYYLLSKYELTRGQYDAIREGKCPADPPKTAALPVTNISIKEARDTADLYSEFLQKNENTPKAGKEKAHAGLPDESYWSFAQRGGLAVTREELQADLPKLPGNARPEDYAWASGSQSSSGKIQIVGLKVPNMLGFYDMLGNAQEYMNNEFETTNALGLDGNKGGITLRGGSYLKPLQSLTSAARASRQEFQNGERTKAKDTGFRLILNVSALTDIKSLNERTAQVQKQLALLEQARQATDDPARQADILKEQEELKTQLSAMHKELKKLEHKNSSDSLLIYLVIFSAFFAILGLIVWHFMAGYRYKKKLNLEKLGENAEKAADAAAADAAARAKAEAAARKKRFGKGFVKHNK